MTEESFVQTCIRKVHQQSFYNNYWKTFDVVEANNDALRHQVFALRYQVYCQENKYCDSAHFPDLLEKDAFDKRATHYLMTHKRSCKPMGTLRVILPNDKMPLTSFEVQKYCDHPLLQIENRVQSMAEISRFCVAPSFRQRARDGHLLPAYYEPEEDHGQNRGLFMPLFRRRIPYAPIGLLTKAFEKIMDAGIINVVMMLESKQFHSLRHLGLHYRVLGPRLSVHGLQQPLVFNIKAVLDNMAEMNPDSWEVASDKGRLHSVANKLYQFDWQDSIFDDACREMILRKLL